MTKAITKEGYEKLKAELAERTTTIRQRITNDIKEAKELGDLRENAEYASAKAEQAENEQKIAELEATLKEVEIVKRDKNSNEVQLGDKVLVRFSGGEIEYEIVSSNEADPSARRISNESPIGEALLGSKIGDTVKVDIPSGSIEYEIISIN